MTQEEKQLLLKDLCGRLPYEVFCSMGLNYPLPLQRLFIDKLDGILLDFYEDGKDYQVYLSEVKPYLRPLSSMTEEEKREYQAFFNYDGVEYPEEYIDWLNVHHFDFRNLIERGLAIAVTEDNNPYK